jgi:5'-methylthioadenosine phosphorylase
LTGTKPTESSERFGLTGVDTMANAPVAIIGGTGFYRFLDDQGEDVTVPTPFGDTSAPIRLVRFAGRDVAFLPRHGRGHEYMPAKIPYRANMYALKELGVRQVVAFNSVGSLQPGYRKGDIVLVDQFVDRTWGREDSYFSDTDPAHVSPAEPYCPRIRALAADALENTPATIHREGVVVVIQGPRFSSTAESRWFSSHGWHLVNMTQYPEVVLAREQELCYVCLAYVTDYDVAAKEVVAGEEHEKPVSHAEVLRTFNADSGLVYDIVRDLVEALPVDFDCSCQHALEDARI